MSYTPHTWTTGETITASKMNNLEDGVQSASGYDFIIRSWSNGGSSSLSVLKGVFSELSTQIANGEALSGLFKVVYISGTWVQETTSTNIYLQWNPSTSTIYGTAYYYWDGSTISYPFLWDSTGIYYND